jgi:hypothetical protein
MRGEGAPVGSPFTGSTHKFGGYSRLQREQIFAVRRTGAARIRRRLEQTHQRITNDVVFAPGRQNAKSVEPERTACG